MKIGALVTIIICLLSIMPLVGVVIGYWMGRSKSKQQRTHWLLK